MPLNQSPAHQEILKTMKRIVMKFGIYVHNIIPLREHSASTNKFKHNRIAILLIVLTSKGKLMSYFNIYLNLFIPLSVLKID